MDIQSGIVHGRFPGRILALVQEWRHLYLTDLLANWNRARLRAPLEPIGIERAHLEADASSDCGAIAHGVPALDEIQ